MEDWLQGAHGLYQTSAAKHFKFLLLGSSLFPDVSLFLGLRLVTFPNLFFSRVFLFQEIFDSPNTTCLDNAYDRKLVFYTFRGRRDDCTRSE